ncbi:PD-(D/E)XK nuclease family protein [Bradyrhizobium nanningense]|uniref:PD-(D/E)XK nuclease family protein n=1 Tax=Bradyrhizobium nanningense TaxID=1325118 RepID=UPI001008C131|nr:PD-(D/E)XK nuclease family protein [Bradyrhizobium nanningense]
MTTASILHSVLVQGRLAFAMRRAAAARDRKLGIQILTPPQLAARLAGGLLHPASRESVEIGIRKALGEPGLLKDIAPISDLPGAARAIFRTLRNIWRSGFDLRTGPYAGQPRIQDLARIEDTVRLHLQPGERLLPDLCDLARAAVSLAPRVVGPLRLQELHTIDPIWRPLINELCKVIPVEWDAPAFCDASWFEGTLNRAAPRTFGKRRAASCADPHHEALEAMRWARELLAFGRARASEIAIATTAPVAWDDYMLALVSASNLPLCFVHGRPALATRDGQRCAALADALRGGLSQARVRRLLSLAADQGTVLDALPAGLPVPSEAALSAAADWERALAPYPETASILMPVLKLIESGTDAAEEAAKLLLRGRSRRLWDEALRSAPASALMFSLESLRVAEDRDPADSVAWCSADQLAAAPRPFVWLMGLTTSGWPRSGGLDPLLPSYIVPSELTDPDPIEAADRRCFDIVLASTEETVVSAGRLSCEGKRVGPSALIRVSEKIDVLSRDRAAGHALTEADRLFARPQDRGVDPIVTSAMAAWHDWSSRKLTPHDGLVENGHPRLSELLPKPQSPTSLSLLLRDPLAYVWYYGLGWRDLVHKERELVLPADDMGRLVHELLRRTVDQLEPKPGFIVAARHEIQEALAMAAAHVIDSWPLVTNVPPPVLWANTVRQAAEMSLAGLTFETFTEAGTRSWTEVPFGGEVREGDPPASLPWDLAQPVILPGTDIRIRGSIDRLDLRASAAAVRVTDYKTGQRPKAPDQMSVDGGAELQRVLYSLACRQLLPDTQPLIARLIYLRPPVKVCPLKNPDGFIDVVAAWVKLARSVLEAGFVYPGIANMPERFGRIALPAAVSYIERKSSVIREAAGRELAAYWGTK